MNTTIKLLDKYREVCQLPSDNQVAIRLGVTRGTVSNWRKERNHAEPESVQAMAKACGLNAEEMVLRVQADREIVAARKQVWLRIAERFAATAAGVTLACCLAVYTPKTEANGVLNNNRHLYTLCAVLALNLRRVVAMFGPRQGVTRAKFVPA